MILIIPIIIDAIGNKESHRYYVISYRGEGGSEMSYVIRIPKMEIRNT